MILPDGAVELIINLGDAQKLCQREDHNRGQLFRHSWLSGERTAPIVIDEVGAIDLLGVRLRPGGAWPILALPLSEFTDRVVELDAVLGREIDRLREMLGEVESDERRFTLLESWLTARIQTRTAPTPAVQHALQLITRDPAVRIGNIPGRLGISHKHFLREFERCVGLTPKTFARLSTFQRVIGWIGQKQSVNWSDAVAFCGYYDQAHLIHEFRGFSGLTPTEYLARRGAFPNYLTLPT